MNIPLGRCPTVLLTMPAMLLCTQTTHASLGGDATTGKCGCGRAYLPASVPVGVEPADVR